jgi:hypothetical protein
VTCRRDFELVNRFIGYSRVVTTNNYDTIKITVVIIHKATSSTSVCLVIRWILKNLYSLEVRISLIFTSLSESYITTDGQSASLSWNKASIWGLRPDFYYCQTVAGLLMWGALSDERTGLSFRISAGPVGLVTIFYCLRFETSLFVASCDSESYGGGIRHFKRQSWEPRFHNM